MAKETLKRQQEKWLKKVNRLQPIERQDFWTNLKSIKRAFNGFRTNMGNAKNVNDAGTLLTNKEKALLIAAVEAGNVIDKALESRTVSQKHGELLYQPLEWWIDKAAKKTIVKH